MPELPEVETTRRGILPYVEGQQITSVDVRQHRLRYPVPRSIAAELPGQDIRSVARRGKYLLFECTNGSLIMHLGMSGSLRIVRADDAPTRHDHVDLCLASGICLRLRDPRRFGLVLWTRRDVMRHRLLRELGPEPLSADFSAEYLYRYSRCRRQAIKPLIMDSHCVVGVGNIYASEALYHAGIHPARPAGRISRQRYQILVEAIQRVLEQAIDQGGTTLRDFYYGNQQPGYFAQSLRVYGRDEQPCGHCASPIRMIRLGQRASYYCPRCQR